LDRSKKLQDLLVLIAEVAWELGYAGADEVLELLRRSGGELRVDAEAPRIASQIRQAKILAEGEDSADFVEYLHRELLRIGRRESLKAKGPSEPSEASTAAARCDYVDVNGVKTYYEAHGSGDVVLVLHGGLTPIELLRAQMMALSSQHTVIAPERPGHGRTPDVSGPITYESMVDHTAGFMRALGLDAAHIVGWSDGGIIGLFLAARRPAIVKSVAAISAPYNYDGNTPEFLELIRQETAETFHAQAVEVYRALSPDGPEHWPVIFDKMKAMTLTPWGLTSDELSGIRAPTLICAAETDIVTHEQCLEMHRLIEDSQLCILPGTTHLMPLEEAELLNPILMRFLQGACSRADST